MLIPTVTNQDAPSGQHPGGEVQLYAPDGTMITQEIRGVTVKSGLKLDQVREAKMVRDILNRMQEVDAEMGVIRGGMSSAQGWMWYRENFQMQYDGDFRWREQMGGIFQYSNSSLNIAKRFARLLHAKCSDNLLGTNPFFSSMQKNDRDPELAKQAEWYLQEKIGASNFSESTTEGMRGALIRGEAVLKPAYEFVATPFIGPGIVLVGRDGQPITTKKGKLIFQYDNELPDPAVQGQTRLAKEPSFIMPPQGPTRYYRYFEALPQVNIMYDGVGVNQVFYKDFGCPLKCDTIYKADINYHVYDEAWSDLKERYHGIPEAANYFNGGWNAGKSDPNTKRGEELSVNKDIPIVNVGEFFVRMDADQDGRAEEIWAVIDIKNQKPIWYDYLSNHMSQRPFGVIHGVEKVEGRWYGVGIFEQLAMKQEYVDTQFNRLNWKSSKASSLRFYNSSAVKEWSAGTMPVLGDDQFYDINDPMFNKDTPPAFEVNFGEKDEIGQNLMQTQIASAQVEVGIIGPSDADFAGSDSQKTATGVRNMERTGNQLEKAMEKGMSKDIERLIDITADTVLRNMDTDELIYYPDAQALISLNREEISNLKRSITLTLSRTRSTETLENSVAVINLCNQYYALDPFRQYKLRPEYLRQLKALEVQDADELLDEVTKEDVQEWQAQQAAQANQEEKPPSRSVSAKLGDLAPSERDQWIRSIGITPASPEEVMAKRVQDAKLKTLEKPAPAPKPAAKKKGTK